MNSNLKFQVCVSDNCSTDNTKEICLSYIEKDHRIKYIRNEKNLGLTGNLNVLIKHSSCELIANLFDGDLYDKNLLTKWVTALTLNNNAAFVFNSYAEIDSNKNIINIFEELLYFLIFHNLMLNQHFLELDYIFDKKL